MIDRLRGQARPRQGLDLLGIEPAIEQRDVLRLAREHVMHGEPAEMAVLQILERVLEDDVARRAIAVDQHEAALRLARQDRS